MEIAPTQVRISWISTVPFLAGATMSLPSRNVCDSTSFALSYPGQRLASSTNWPPVILITSLCGMG